MIRISEEQQNKILSAIGMKSSMEAKAPHYEIDLPNLSFQIYHPRKSKDPYIQEMDQIYRVSGKNIIHTVSGLRLYYSEYESWDGETLDYTLLDIFVYTKKGERMDIINVNWDKKVFHTPDGVILFAEVDLTPRDLD